MKNACRSADVVILSCMINVVDLAFARVSAFVACDLSCSDQLPRIAAVPELHKRYHCLLPQLSC